MTEFRFPPFMLPEPGQVEAPATELGDRTSAQAARDAAVSEFSFPPLRLPEPVRYSCAPAAVRPGSSCCANCDQGLPCRSTGDAGATAHGRPDVLTRPATRMEGCDPFPSPKPPSPFPLTSKPMPPHPHPAPLGFASRQLPGVGAPPFWEPKDLEVELKPLFGCKIGEDDWGQGKECDPDWDPAPSPHQYHPEPPPPIDDGGYCGPVPSKAVDVALGGHDGDCGDHRCGLDACSEGSKWCWRISSGVYSPKSRTRPFFSYSEWKNGYLVNADCSIIRRIAYEIARCKAGDSVHIAISAWWLDAWPIVEAVAAAHVNGATVRVISGKESDSANIWNHTHPWIRSRLDASIGNENYRLWSLGKSPTFENASHNKFVLIKRWIKPFSQVHTLVFTGGANWAPFDVARHCDLLAVNSSPIYYAYLRYWTALWNEQDGKAEWGDVKFEVEDPELGLSAHFWPVLIGGKPDPDGQFDNPFIKIIGRYRPEIGTKIRVIAAAWENDTPGASMVETLKTYRAAGADVRVIGNHHLDTGCHNVGGCEMHPHSGGSVGVCETRDTIWQSLDDAQIPWAKCPPHAKVLLVSGRRFEDDLPHQSVYTGSMNISYKWGLQAMPDAFIGVHDDSVIFSQYDGWWNWLCSYAAMSRGGPAPVCGAPQPVKPSPLPLKMFWKPSHG